MTRADSVLNGVRPDGTYAYPPPDDTEIARWFEPVDPRSNMRGPRWYVEPEDLSSAGWAVVYAPGERARIEPLLEDLLELRRREAGPLYQDVTLYPKEDCDLFLERFGANTGRADPRRLPYYLLLVGSPEQIPFDFQGRLDQTYAVGRLQFARDEHYRAYATAVRDAETDPARKSTRRITLFGALNEGDNTTERTTSRLIRPLAETIEGSLRRLPGWQVSQVTGPRATREALSNLLTGDETPDLLFTAGHGMVFGMDDPRQKALQGALLCSDWAGPGNAVTRDTYLAAEDLQIDGRPLHGAITFHLACHSGGTPVWDSFHQPGTRGRERLTRRSFVAALPQRLLGEAGALAVIAHADRAWTTSFDWNPLNDRANPEVFEDTVLPLLSGRRVGNATESLGAAYGQLASHVKERRDKELLRSETRAGTDPTRTARFWRASNDIRSFVVFGDPAVRLGGKAPDRARPGWR